MKKKIYYLLSKVFYHIKEGNNVAFEYFFNKAEAIAEAEYTKEIMDFYEG